MSYYALQDTDWSFDDEGEGRAVIVCADTPEEAIRLATERHVAENPGAGGVTWNVARLHLVAFGDAGWEDDNKPSFEPLTYYTDGINGLPDTPPLYASPVTADAGEPGIKALPDDLLERLEAGVPHAGMHDDNSTELFDVEDASDTMWEAAQFIRSALVPTTSPAKGGAEVTWTRDDLAFGLASLDGVTLHDIRSTVGPVEDANNWRDYLGRADDLLAYLSQVSALRTSAPVGRQAKEGGE